MRKRARARHAAPCGADGGGANDEGHLALWGEETGWAAYLFFSFASSRLSAAELMQ